jgi:hypothetical protein
MKFYNDKDEIKTIPFIILMCFVIILFAGIILGSIILFPNKIPQPELVYYGEIESLSYSGKIVQAITNSKDFIMHGNIIGYLNNNHVNIITTRDYWFADITSINNIDSGIYYIYHIDYNFKKYYCYVISPTKITNWNNITWEHFDH